MVRPPHRCLMLAVAGLVGTLTSVVDPAGPATADTAPEFAVSVSPTRIVVPPEQIGQPVTVKVTNRGRQPVELVVEKREVRPSPDGTVLFPQDAPYSARHWIATAPQQLRLAPQQAREVAVEVALPEQYEPGDHHLALVFVAPATTATGNVRVNRGIGIPVYVQAPGPVDRTVWLTDLAAPRFAIGGPVTFTASVAHTGTVHRDFRQQHRLAVEVGGGQVPVPEFTVLRDSTREVSARWEDPPLACVCRASLALPGPGGGRQEVTVVIFPVHLVAGALAIAGAVALSVLVRHRRQRRTAPR